MISVGFSTTNHLLSRIIRKFTKSKVSHTWLLFEDDTLGMPLVIQAELTGLAVVPYDVFAKKNSIIAEIRSTHDLTQAVRFMGSHLSDAYDFGGLFGSIFVLMGRWLKLKWGNPWNNAGALFCSEAVTVALQTAGYPDSAKLIAACTTPEDLLEFLQG